MKKLKKISMMRLAIGLSFLYIIFYSFGIAGIYDFQYLFTLFLFSPIIVLWVVFSVLKDKNEPTKTFTDHFYQDSEIKRTKTNS